MGKEVSKPIWGDISEVEVGRAALRKYFYELNAHVQDLIRILMSHLSKPLSNVHLINDLYLPFLTAEN